jgi:hypothetical protein
LAAAILIGAGIVGVAYFAGQAQHTQSLVRAAYEQEGANNFVVEVSGRSDDEVDRVAAEVCQLTDVSSADVPYNGVELGVQADTSFLVFENAQQKEYLGAHNAVLGVGPLFKPRNGYYVDFRWLNRSAPRAVLGIPFLPVAGEFRPPQVDELLLPITVTDYVGVQPGARATVELVYANANPPIVRRLDNLRLVGTFDIAGPDRGRIDPFWRLSYIGEPLLTARGAGGTEPTTVPVLLNETVVQDFLRTVESQLRLRRPSSNPAPARGQLVVAATSVADVPGVENEVVSVLEAQGMKPAGATDLPSARTFRILLPERNNFATAQREQQKIGTGATYFGILVLVLLVFATGGLQVVATLARWRDYGVLQAVGFSPGQICVIYGGQLLLVLTSAILFAGLVVLFSSHTAESRRAFAIAAMLAAAATAAGTTPALLWPIAIRPAEMLKELQ